MNGPRRAPGRAGALIAVLLVLAPAAGRAGGDAARCDRPELTRLRYDEDYSFLRDPRCRTDLWDPLKHLSVSRSPEVYLTLGIDVRERYEYFSTFDWGRDPDVGAGFLLQRVMPHVGLRIGTHVQAFFQLTSNLVWGRDPTALDRDDLDVLQAFTALSFGGFTVRGGRQEIEYASSRLVSVREGPNVRLVFDGVRLMQRIRDWQVDAFALVPVAVAAGGFDDGAPPGEAFWGVYATGPILRERLGLDLYYLGRLREAAEFEQGIARELRHTVGASLWGDVVGLDYNVELTYQTGSFGAGRISAWMVASDVGYSFAVPTRPRLGIQVNAVSGDRDPRNPDLQTFNPLFPRGAYFSQANLIGPLNLVDVHPAVTIRPKKGLEIILDWDFFWRQSLGDGLYLPSTALQVAGAGNPARYIGSQGAVLLQWQATRHTSLAATYSHFFAGPFLRFASLASVSFVGLWISYAI